MVAWLVAWPYLLFASVALAASGLNIASPLFVDCLRGIFSQLEFADLYQASLVSKGFCRLAYHAFQPLHGVGSPKGIYISYSLLFYRLDALVQDAGNGSSMAEANAALKSSATFQCIEAILEARFGCCIKYAGGQILGCALQWLPFDILNDRHAASVLPYFLDQRGNFRWIHFIRGLADHGRHDLLDQLTFAKITTLKFCQLMSVPLSESVVGTAAKALQQNEPDSGLANLLAWAILDGQAVRLPERCQVPLFLLGYFYEKGISLPEDGVLVLGLDESSIQFWMYLLHKNDTDAKNLLDLVSEYGDTKTKHLASAFLGIAPCTNLDRLEKDVYQAVLIRFYFSSTNYEHVIQNYKFMLKRPLEKGYHTTCALLECGDYKLADRFGASYLSDGDLGQLVDRLYQIKDGALEAYVQECLGQSDIGPELLKALIQREAEGACIELVWNSIQSKQDRSNDDYCCAAPVGVLKRLLLERGITIEDAQSMLSTLEGALASGGRTRMSKEAHALYTAMFWEAHEMVVEYFLDQIPQGCELDQHASLELLQSTKYSGKLWSKLVRRLHPISVAMQLKFHELRPDLVLELGSALV